MFVKNLVVEDFPKNIKIQKDNNTKKKSELSFGKLNNKETEELIEKIISWYKIKFSGSKLLSDDSSKNMDFDDNFYTMTFSKLNDRLNCDEIDSFKCQYINIDYNMDFREIKKSLDIDKSCIAVELFTTKNNFLIKKYDKICFLIIEKDTGKLVDVKGDFLLPKEFRDNYFNYELRQILSLLESNNNGVNLSVLKKCILHHDKDMLVRMKVINNICDKLLFGFKDDFDLGYYAAMIFLDDINSFYGLDINYNYLDTIIDKHYKNKKKKKKSRSQ